MKVTGVSEVGYTYLYDGTLSITDPNTLPNAVYPVIFTNKDSRGATLQFSAPLTFQNPILIGKDFEAVIDVDTNPINLYSKISDLTSGGNLSFIGGNTVTSFGVASNSGITSIDAGTALKAGSNALLSNRSLYAVSGVLDLNNYNQTIKALSGGGEVALGTATLTVDGSTEETLFSGTISGKGSVVLKAGELTLANNNSYTGKTTVEVAGTLMAAANHPISSSEGLRLDGTLLANDFQVALNGLSGKGNLNLGTKGTGIVALLGSETHSFDGNIVGDGHLTVGSKNSKPTLLLSGSNTHSGSTTILGTVQAKSETALSNNSTITVEPSGSLDINGFSTTLAGLSGAGKVKTQGASLTVGSGNFSGEIQDNAPLIKSTAHTLTLSGSNAVSSIRIEEGNLAVHQQNNIGTEAITFEGADATSAKLTFLQPNQTFTNPILVADEFEAHISGNQTTLKGNITDLTRNGNVQFDGQVILTGDNSYSGNTHIAPDSTLYAASATALSPISTFVVEGNLELSADNTLNALEGNGNIVLGREGSPTLSITHGNDLTFSGSIAGPGSLTLQRGDLVLTGKENTLAGTTTIAPTATLVAAASGSLSPLSQVVVDGTLKTERMSIHSIPSLSGTGEVVVGTVLILTDSTNFAGNISGTGGVSFLANGPSCLSGNNSYSGPTTLSNGSLTALSTTALSPSSDFAVDGSLVLTDCSNTVGTLTGFGSVDVGQEGTLLTIADGNERRFCGDITGNGGVVLQNGKWEMCPTTSNRYTGPTTIESGATLIVGATNALPQQSDFHIEGTLSLSSGHVDFDATLQTLAGANPKASIDLGSNKGGILTINGSSSTAYAGTMTGCGGLTIQEDASLILNGATSYSGVTTVKGDLIAGADRVFSAYSTYAVDGTLSANDKTHTIGALTGSGIVDLGYASNTVFTVCGGDFEGHIIGLGQLLVNGRDKLTLQADQSYSGGTKIVAGSLVLKGAGALLSSGNVDVQSGGIFDISQMTASSQTVANLNGSKGAILNLGDKQLVVDAKSNSSYNGLITGTDGSLRKQGKATLTLDGISNFTGGIEVADGTLVGTVKSLNGNIQVDVDTHLIFNQKENGTFLGHLSGEGKFCKFGSGKLNLISGVSSFNGMTMVKEGNLALNTDLGGNVTVQAGGMLSGNGSLSGNLLINKGGIISPSNSTEMITVHKDYVQRDGSTFVAQIDGQGESSLIDVGGAAALGGHILATTIDGKIKLNHHYHLLHAEEGVTGSFSNLSIKNNPPLYASRLIYGQNDLFLKLISTFVNGAQNNNQANVALQLDGITKSDPLLNGLFSQMAILPIEDVSFILQQLSGQQQTADLFAVGVINRQFLRRLYDPLRPIVTTLPGCYTSSSCGWTVWVEGGQGQTFVDNSDEASGFKLCGGHITSGIQKTFSELTLGFAGSYDYEKLSFKQSGTGRLNSTFAGLYALYRPDCFYLLADMAYGYSHDRLSRQVFLPGVALDISSSADINQYTLYAEGGIDLLCGHLLIQPFAAIEGGGAWKSNVHERGGADLGLDVESREEGTCFSRLGLHATTTNWPGVVLSLDAAWRYRFTKNSNCVWQQFATFGSPFVVEGVHIDRNCFEGAATLTCPCSDSASLYIEGEGEIWSKASTYSVILGFTASW